MKNRTRLEEYNTNVMRMRHYLDHINTINLLGFNDTGRGNVMIRSVNDW